MLFIAQPGCPELGPGGLGLVGWTDLRGQHGVWAGSLGGRGGETPEHHVKGKLRMTVGPSSSAPPHQVDPTGFSG